MEVLLISWIDLAFIMWGTCRWTASPPLPFICVWRLVIDPRSVEPTCPVCLKSIGWPIMDLSIRARLGGASCSVTQEPNNCIQNSPAISKMSQVFFPNFMMISPLLVNSALQQKSRGFLSISLCSICAALGKLCSVKSGYALTIHAACPQVANMRISLWAWILTW